MRNKRAYEAMVKSDRPVKATPTMQYLFVKTLLTFLGYYCGLYSTAARQLEVGKSHFGNQIIRRNIISML